ncbi:MAG: hypothetical protein ACYTFG_18230 [Planctomycetota bacterium]|jgi:hypothetical protein
MKDCVYINPEYYKSIENVDPEDVYPEGESSTKPEYHYRTTWDVDTSSGTRRKTIYVSGLSDLAIGSDDVELGETTDDEAFRTCVERNTLWGVSAAMGVDQGTIECTDVEIIAEGDALSTPTIVIGLDFMTITDVSVPLS